MVLTKFDGSNTGSLVELLDDPAVAAHTVTAAPAIAAMVSVANSFRVTTGLLLPRSTLTLTRVHERAMNAPLPRGASMRPRIRPWQSWLRARCRRVLRRSS